MDRFKVSKKQVLLLFLIILFFVILGSAFFALNNSTEYRDSEQIKSKEIENFPTATSKLEITSLLIIDEIPEHKLEVAGWIPTWASGSGLQSLQNHPDYFTTVSPVWYEVRADGILNPKYPANKSIIISHARSHNLKLIPTIGMFDHNIFGGILRSEENRKRHIDSIVTIVNTNNYHGIDLDYESISLADQDLYFQFLEELSEKLHTNSKTLTVTVLPKWGENAHYSYKPETRQVQDWSRIALLADEVRIMAYDYTHSSDYYPGPIGPTGWIRQILDYARDKIPADKTVLGIHLYAYEWYQPANVTEELEIKTDFSLNRQQNPRPARAYTYSTVERILRDYQGERSTFEGEGVFFYKAVNQTSGVEENRALIYIDPEGVEERTYIAEEYKLKGVVFWRLGGERFEN